VTRSRITMGAIISTPSSRPCRSDQARGRAPRPVQDDVFERIARAAAHAWCRHSPPPSTGRSRSISLGHRR
jgi:hypothetical protein